MQQRCVLVRIVQARESLLLRVARHLACSVHENEDIRSQIVDDYANPVGARHQVKLAARSWYLELCSPSLYLSADRGEGSVGLQLYRLIEAAPFYNQQAIRRVK